MLLKSWNMLTRTKKGVENVIILNGKIEHSILLELFTEEGAGTLIKENKTQEDITWKSNRLYVTSK